MGYKKATGICPRCGRMVLMVYPSPCHLLHLILSLMSRGLWIAVWILMAIQAYRRCRCRRCGVHVPVRRYMAASFSTPWQDEKFTYCVPQVRCDFNTLLIENGLVFYASTRPVKSRRP